MCDAVPSCQMRVSYFFSSSLFVNLNFFQRVSGDATQLLTDKNYVTIPMITTDETQKKTIPTGNKKIKKNTFGWKHTALFTPGELKGLINHVKVVGNRPFWVVKRGALIKTFQRIRSETSSAFR